MTTQRLRELARDVRARQREAIADLFEDQHAWEQDELDLVLHLAGITQRVFEREREALGIKREIIRETDAEDSTFYWLVYVEDDWERPIE